MDSPKQFDLIQMTEGYVAIKTTHDFNTSIPTNCTHIKVYLSTTNGFNPSIVNLYTIIERKPEGGLSFNLTPGWFGYALLTAYNNITNEESAPSSQYTLQMYERVCYPRYNIMHFFHDINTNSQWAIGFRHGDCEVCILKSTDYFENYVLISSWPRGQIDNGGMLTLYIDKFGFIYIANRPSALISKDGGITWNQLPWSFQSPQNGQLTPFWNITEDEEHDLIVFSEYGSLINGPHHLTFWSSDQNRNIWTNKLFEGNVPGFQSALGEYRHIHGYHINPYKNNIHFLFLGDPYMGSNNQLTDSDGTPGFYISQDSGITWSTEVLNQGPHTSNHITPFGDNEFRNAPCHVTWWKNGKALISNDTGKTNLSEWWGNGPNNWGYNGLQPRLNLTNDIEDWAKTPATPWGAIAVKDSYETYCVSNHSADPVPSLMWRYDGNESDEGNTGKGYIIAICYYPAKPFLYTSAGRGNILPANADYFFSNAWGGIRIPRKPNNKKHIITSIKLNQNYPNSFSRETFVPISLPLDTTVAKLKISTYNNEQVQLYTLTERGEFTFTIADEDLVPGTFIYSLYVEDILIESRQMVKVLE